MILSEQAKRVSSLVDEIEDYNNTISNLEYQICDCNPEDPGALEDEQMRLQGRVNDMVNDLKAENIEIAYDTRLIQVKRDGVLWLEYREGGSGWIEHTRNAMDNIAFTGYWHEDSVQIVRNLLSSVVQKYPGVTIDCFYRLEGIPYKAKVSYQGRVFSPVAYDVYALVENIRACLPVLS